MPVAPDRPHPPGESPDQEPGVYAASLAVVINAADPLSEAIGRSYARARRLQPRQLIRIRFRASSSLDRSTFQHLFAEVQRQTPPGTQAYALAWAAPWRVECVSMTTAFAFGRVRSSCQDTCAPTPVSPYFSQGHVRRPWDELGMRPTIMLAATSLNRAKALIERGIAADGSAPDGTAYLLSSSDPIRNVRAAAYPAVVRILGSQTRVRLFLADALRSRPDVLLLSVGAVHVDGITSNTYLPGALADHLTSLGGVLTGASGQMSALRWLEAGATGSYGTVVEPCNHPGKFPDPGLALA